MSFVRAPGAVQEQARRILHHLLGGHSMLATIGVIAFLVTLGWFTDSLFEWLIDIGHVLEGGRVDHWLPAHRLIALGIFASELIILALLARKARRRYRPRVGSEPAPAPVRGLILFLSNLGPQQANELEQMADVLTSMDGFRAQHGALNWRMPLEAIAYHLSRLREVVVITSRGPMGSASQYILFHRVAKRCFPGAGFRLRAIGELDSRYSMGLDFEDVDRVSQATDDAYEILREGGLRQADILIDVTGGQKPNAVAATAVALAEGRQIQYVTCDRVTGECHLSVYDVTYDA
jgi:hypothetical protein